jgi:hypothetical protein
MQNISVWCHHLYRRCGCAKYWYVEEVPCLVSEYAKLHVAGWMWADFKRVYLESCAWPVAIFTMDHRNAPSQTSVLTQQFRVK